MHLFGNFIKNQVAVGGWTNIWVPEFIALINVSILWQHHAVFITDSILESKIRYTFHHSHISYILINIIFIVAIF